MIRDATVSDARRLAEITLDGWQRGYVGIVPDEVLARQRIDRHLASFASREAMIAPMRTLVAEVGGRVVGYTHGGPVRSESGESLDGAELWGMYVDPSHGGHSWALLTAMEDHFRTDGHEVAYLWVLRDNTHARTFYEAAGWALDHRRERTEPLPQVRYQLNL
ncbi:GNAT family N-acetyltransferase [Actinomycetota bacterium]